MREEVAAVVANVASVQKKSLTVEIKMWIEFMWWKEAIEDSRGNGH